MQSVQKCAKMVCKNMEACHARALRWCAAKGKLLTRRSMIATCMTSRGLRPAVAQRTSGIHGAAASLFPFLAITAVRRPLRRATPEPLGETLQDAAEACAIAPPCRTAGSGRGAGCPWPPLAPWHARATRPRPRQQHASAGRNPPGPTLQSARSPTASARRLSGGVRGTPPAPARRAGHYGTLPATGRMHARPPSCAARAVIGRRCARFGGNLPVEDEKHSAPRPSKIFF